MTFRCPRCKQPADAEYYGPCSSCRDQLRAIETLPHPQPAEHFVGTSLGMSDRAAVAYIGPRVDDPSFVGRDRRQAAAAEAEEALRERMRDVWPSHLIPGGS